MAYVLVADDELAMRQILREALRIDGHTVEVVCDGNEVMRMLHERVPDVVVVDIIMPDKEGLETIIEMRREYPSVKIIAMSGGARIGPDGYLSMAEHLGAARIFQKPFELNDLRKAIKELLEERPQSKP